jgi:hypothetical protein
MEKGDHDMVGSLDVRQVIRHQDELRREAAQHRLATRINRNARKNGNRGRRVFGLRLSFA